MGVITEAIKKVEKKESFPPPPEGMSPLPKRRKRLIIAVVAFLFIGACLGLGYSFLLKPTFQSPPKTAGKSMAAKKKIGKPALKQSEQKKDTAMTEGVVGQLSADSAPLSPGVTKAVRAPEKKMATRQKGEITPPKLGFSDLLSESDTSSGQKKVPTPKSNSEGTPEPASDDVSPEGKSKLPDIGPSGGKGIDSEEYVADEVSLPEKGSKK